MDKNKITENRKKMDSFLKLLEGSIENIQQKLNLEYGIPIYVEKIVNSIKNDNFDINSLYDGVSLLHLAIITGNENLVKNLLDLEANVNISDKYNRTPIIYAIKENHPKIVSLLINSGADVNHKDFIKQSPLHFAAQSFNKVVVQQLLDAGCNVNVNDHFGNQPIDYILGKNEMNFIDNYCDKDKRELINLICEHELDLNFKNTVGTKILHNACKYGLLDLVKLLVKYGANLLSVENGSSTLHKAVLGNNFNLVDYLMHNGLDVNVEDNNKETPLHRLSVFNHSPDFDRRSLNEKSDIPDFELQFRKRQMRNYIEMIEFLVDNGADVNAFDKNSVAPIEKSIYLNLLEISELLLELKASVEFRKDVIFFSYQSNKISTFNSTRIDTLALLTAFLAIKKEDIYEYILSISHPWRFGWIEPCFLKCKIELNRMKERHLCDDRNITVYDILVKDLMEVVALCKNQEVMLILETMNYGNEFPCYEYLLKKRIERLQHLRNCRNVIIRFFGNFFKRQLPIIVFDEIFKFLNVGDLRNFERALSVRDSDYTGNYFV